MATDVPPFVERLATTVRFVEVDDEIGQIRAAWLTLEAAVGSMRGRHFVGAFDPGQGWYRACVEVRADVTPAEDALPEAVIPGGRFARARLRGEPPGVYDEIAPAYERLEQAVERDDARPSLEVYRRRDMIDVLMPVTEDTAGSQPSTGAELVRSGPDPAPSGNQTRLGLAVVLAIVLVVAVLVAFSWRPAGRGVQDGVLVLHVDQAQVVDILSPGQVTAHVQGTLQNPTDDPVTVSAASIGGFAQRLSVTVPAHGSAHVTLNLQVSCDTTTQPPPSMATLLTVSTDGGPARTVTARVVQTDVPSQLVAGCRQRVFGS